MKTLLPIVVILISFHFSLAQYDPNYIPEEEPSMANFGLGIGLSYGGIGARVEFLPVQNFALLLVQDLISIKLVSMPEASCAFFPRRGLVRY